MNSADFDKIVKNTMGRTSELLIKKGAEYAGDEDRLANFKRNAAKNGQTVLETWQTYWGKHIDSINSFMARVKDEAVRLALVECLGSFEGALSAPEQLPTEEALTRYSNPTIFRKRVEKHLPAAIRNVEAKLSEAIEGRFDDNINYSLLCLGILTELRDQGKEVNLFQMAQEMRETVAQPKTLSGDTVENRPGAL